MRLLVHDFAGHPFQAQLSRQLAAQGHEVIHVYPAGLPGPKGRLEKSASDPEQLQFAPIQLSGRFRKYSPHRRFLAQRKYARDLKALIRSARPDAVLSGNTPIDVQVELLWCCRRNRIGFVHWVQDVYCQALEFFLRRKLGLLSKPVTLPFQILEKIVASFSNSIVVIAPGFRRLLVNWGIPESKITVIENWAPLDEMPQLSRQNAWSAAQGLGQKPVLLYSGTLGLKHRPDLIYTLAKELGSKCKIVVITDGVGRDYLARMPKLDNLVLLGFQPYERVPEVLASADVLLATLEADAGQFAVPSKILTYLCAGRPVLLAAPGENLAADIVKRSKAGVIVDPDDSSAWVRAARKLVSDAAYRKQLALNARKYAEETFEIGKIASLFEHVLLSAYTGHPKPTPAVSPVPVTFEN
jgi:glycosyltransferase involved in cell wall biosynthesis